VDEQRRKGASRTQGRNFGSSARFVVRGEKSESAKISDQSVITPKLAQWPTIGISSYFYEQEYRFKKSYKTPYGISS
jgi:hypothetical protein